MKDDDSLLEKMFDVALIGLFLFFMFFMGSVFSAEKLTKQYCEELVLLEPKVKPVIIDDECWVTIQDTGLHMKREDFLKRFTGK